MPTPPSALDVARALVAFPSVTSDDAGALPYVQRLLAEAGFTVEIVSFAEAGTPTIANLWARFGRDAPNFVFAGHTDVVPPGDAAALAEALVALAMDAARRSRLGAESRRLVEGFSDAAVAAQTAAVYRALLLEIGAAPV